MLTGISYIRIRVAADGTSFIIPLQSLKMNEYFYLNKQKRDIGSYGGVPLLWPGDNGFVEFDCQQRVRSSDFVISVGTK